MTRSRNLPPSADEARVQRERLEQLRHDLGAELIRRHGRGAVPASWRQLATAAGLTTEGAIRRVGIGERRAEPATLDRWERAVRAWIAGEESAPAADPADS